MGRTNARGERVAVAQLEREVAAVADVGASRCDMFFFATHLASWAQNRHDFFFRADKVPLKIAFFFTSDKHNAPTSDV